MTGRILVVEDDLLNRLFYHDVLEQEGFDLRQVSDGALVLDEVALFKPDLITMDMQLPNISGLRLIRQLQKDKATCHIPILAITAFAGPQEEKRIRSAGACGYLAKPVTVKQLLEAVSACIEPDGGTED